MTEEEFLTLDSFEQNKIIYSLEAMPSEISYFSCDGFFIGIDWIEKFNYTWDIRSTRPPTSHRYAVVLGHENIPQNLCCMMNENLTMALWLTILKAEGLIDPPPKP